MEGIKNGMVMQRNAANVCDIWFQTEVPPQSTSYQGASCGEAAIKSCGASWYHLTGIPVGGPYTVYIDSAAFENVYVGDVWVLAGQSNMEGCGRLTAADQSFQAQSDVRALYLSNQWCAAQNPLHDLGNAHFRVHALLGGAPKPVLQSAGPGISFGLTMRSYTGVPQGLICCAHGATNLAFHWYPARRAEGTHASLYAAMAQRIAENGSHVCGVFWYQGCSDAEDALCEAYTENMKLFVAACRRDFGKNLPFVQVQIGRTITRISDSYRLWWNRIQEQQRLLEREIANLYTVASITKTLDDAIHIGSDGQTELGAEAAQAMYHLVFGTDKNGCLPPPAMRDYHIEVDKVNGWAIVKIRYCHLHGGLSAPGRAMGFSVLNRSENQFPQWVFKTILEQDTAILYLACTPQELAGCPLYYGYGPDPACNITDSAGRAIPMLGPIIL